MTSLAEENVDPMITNENNNRENDDYHDDYHDDDDDEALAEMERLLAQQEEEDYDEDYDHNLNNNNNNHDRFQLPLNDDNDDDDVNINPHQQPEIGIAAIGPFPNLSPPSTASFFKTNYTSISILFSIIHIIYILRTRKQIYISLMYLTTSRISYILFGNTIIAIFISLYHKIIKYFLNGLRFIESENIADSIRWNITESIFAISMFRQEINVTLMIGFGIVFWMKCLHWAVELRGSHLRMTEDVFYYLNDDDDDNNNSNISDGDGGSSNNNNNPIHNNNNNNNKQSTKQILLQLILPEAIYTKLQTFHQQCPRIRPTHWKYWLLMNLLYTIDLGLVAYCSSELIENGPSAFMFLLFEVAILTISVCSNHCMFSLHVLDGLINVVQKLSCGSDEDMEDNGAVGDGDTHTNDNGNDEGIKRRKIFIGRLASAWRDNRATANFGVELMALSAKFLLHLTLFVTVFATYGLPLSIIRDFYMAYLKLRTRLSAFVSYRRLTCDMDKRFKTVDNEDELEEVGHTCIICRDVMDVHGIHGICKKLPMCGHAFHKHCLREWLVQQHSCPTCRSDIRANEARAVIHEAVTEEEEEEEVEEEEAELVVEEEEENHNDVVEVVHPTLFKLKSNSTVVEFERNNEGKFCQKLTRVIAAGTYVICTETKQWTWDNVVVNIQCDQSATANIKSKSISGDDNNSGLYLKIPDGWISDSDLAKILVLKEIGEQ